MSQIDANISYEDRGWSGSSEHFEDKTADLWSMDLSELEELVLGEGDPNQSLDLNNEPFATVLY